MGEGIWRRDPLEWGAGQRLMVVGATLAVLWGAVAWALA
jgi:hypothetical protein